MKGIEKIYGKLLARFANRFKGAVLFCFPVIVNKALKSVL